MQKIIAAFIAVIAFVTQSKEKIQALKKEIEDRDKIIADLRASIEAEDANDASREEALRVALEAQQASEASLAALNSEIETANSKADEALAGISADAEIPVTISPDGTATATGARAPLGSE